MRYFMLFFTLMVISQSALAAEYCYSQYEGQIQNINAELGDKLKRTQEIDNRVREILNLQTKPSADIAREATKIPPDLSRISQLGQQLETLNKERVGLEKEGYDAQDRISALKGVIPAELQGRLRGCVEASAPANKIVNLTIQALAILSTGGASLALPPKSLYVDMSAVLNGYPTGGPKSVINEARQTALDALGIGGENNDLGIIVKDPLRPIRCIFGC
ncbi:hypothetical protein ACW7BJ_32485 [Azospirillum argentinense]